MNWPAKAWNRLRATLRPVQRAPGELKNIAYDRQTLEVMQCCLGADSACIDGGAHQGKVLADMLRLAPRGRHYAFEPLPALAAQLRQNFPQAQVFQQALGARAGKADFVHVTNAPAYSGLRERTYDHDQPHTETLTVEVVRLDEVIPPDAQIAFIKLDLEGGELHALQGGVELIKRCRPLIVFEAGAPSSGHYGVGPGDIHDFITGVLGYRLATMAAWLQGSAGLGRQAFIDAYPEDFYWLAWPPG